MIRSMLCALVMFLGFIVAPTSAYPTGKVVEVTEAEQVELQAILDGWRKAGFLDR